ncbi:polysaccharide deacetylase family protein [Actinomadura hibisca]|uniref:polysaccharide deacetylase family protein n=1 Tax=Actinomadura hibisca TaxID=68565 RepID=UPI00082E9975|nr:polysaccharide deacetylase [Actinomadura hibisca]
MSKEILVAYGVDVDAVGGWLGSYGGEGSPGDVSRGVFAGDVGVPRMLELFRRKGLRTSWFWPGHSIESFPEQFEACVEAGHEIGAHGYSHENPLDMSREQEADVLDRSIELIERGTGHRPRGYVAPWWEFSHNTAELLVERGFEYDHSLMHRDFEPYYMTTRDDWTNIDYDKPAAEWMKPLRRGEPTDLVEIPASWDVDDLPPLMYIKSYPNSHGYVNPRDLEQQWRDQFDWVYRELDYAIFPMTVHPDVSGRPGTLLMHERLIDYFGQHDGVRWATFQEIADDYRNRNPR